MLLHSEKKSKVSVTITVMVKNDESRRLRLVTIDHDHGHHVVTVMCQKSNKYFTHNRKIIKIRNTALEVEKFAINIKLSKSVIIT